MTGWQTCLRADEIVIGDGNFPAKTNAKRLIRCDGHGVPEILDAILKLMPLDTYVENPVLLMDNGNDVDRPEIWATYEEIVKNAEEKGKTGRADIEILIFDDEPNR